MFEEEDSPQKNNLFHKLFLKTIWKIPGENLVKNAIKNLSLTEKFIALILVALLFVSSGFLIFRANKSLMTEVPGRGGSLIEGIVGSPRFINPVLTLSSADADRDLVALIYAGLLKPKPDGTLAPELAESYSISEDGLVYTFTLKDGIYFHDGTPITTADVDFTVGKAQDTSVRSPRKVNWEGVKTEIVDSKTIKFILSQPYAPFLENTTLGILPKHLWEDLSADQFSFSFLNIEPIGAGPYKIKSVKKDSNGLPISYNLTSFKQYALGEPFIKNITLKFYSNEEEAVEAYESEEVESIYAISPEASARLKEKGANILTTTLPRIFGLFFNQNQASIFTHQEIREALNDSLNKNRVVNEVLLGYGEAIQSPLPLSYLKSESLEPLSTNLSEEELNNKIDKINDSLESDGWKLGEGGIRVKSTKSEDTAFRFAISTSNVPDLKSTAQILQEEWQKIGAEVEIKIFDASGDLTQNVIRPRKYDALLFGISIGRDLDLFPFWHSSQRNDPGFNIALYANITTDKILEQIRTTVDKASLGEKYQNLEKEIKNDVPAVFIYSPQFVYIVPPKIQNLKLSFITNPSDRFLNINEWYIKTENVWKIFTPQEQKFKKS